MKKLVVYILIVFLFLPAFGQELQQTQSKAQLASVYYREKQYEKAAPLFLELIEKSNMMQYFDYYINCLINIKDYQAAIKALKKQIKSTKSTTFQIDLGYVYKEMGDDEKAASTFDEVINNLADNKGAVISTGSSFFNRREFEYAEKTYLKGREILPGEKFHDNLASIYAYQRNYASMMTEYLSLIAEDDINVDRVEGQINALLRYDFDLSLKATVKKEIIKAIQTNPTIIAFNRLLIWVFVLEKNYDQALLNSIALDKRTRKEENNILGFSQGAAQNNLFDIALKGLNYLSTRKPVVQNIGEIKQEIVKVEFKRFLNTPPKERISAIELENKFAATLNELGYKAETADLLKTYAHFLAFYINKPTIAFDVLSKALAISNINNTQRTLLRIEQADINVYDNNLWEATLQYAQIIDANKENPMGDDVKLKKAKLGFYLGDISWARGQLDALKASTSKLIANDAMELSLLISTNYDLDSIEEPIQQYARADLFLFQNKDSLALLTFDSIATKYPLHSLNDEILMKKAEISERKFDFETTASYYETIIKNYAFSSSADNALFYLAKLNEVRFKNMEKAQELYLQVLTNFPGSIYVDEARTKYRILRGDKIDTEEITPNGSPEIQIP